MLSRRTPRIAMVTMGQTPRPDVLAEIMASLGATEIDSFGALDGLAPQEIDAMAPRGDELSFFTRAGDRHVIVEASFVTRQTAHLVGQLDGQGYDLIVLAMTGIRERFATRTPLVHGQYAVEAWIAALTAGHTRIGIIYPLTSQHSVLRESGYGTLLQSSHATIGGHHGSNLTEAIERVSDADLIVMNSVGYTIEMAQQVARASHRPVVTASRIIGSTARLRLAESTGRPPDPPARTYTGLELTRRLASGNLKLTQREAEVLAHALEGATNKFIGRTLGISHRTVEIHRARAMAKLGAGSTAELIWRALARRDP